MIAKGIILLAAILAACSGLLQGCWSSSAEMDNPGGRIPDARSAQPDLPDGRHETINDPALEALWNSRRANSSDFGIGPGDVLEVLVPGVKELSDQTVRVDGKGDIALPLLGTVHVAGLSESQLDSLLVDRLGDYLYHPQAEIFVKSYSSRQVAVTGEVRTPGSYTLNGPEDTMRELMQRAGGLTDHARQEIVLTPKGKIVDSRPTSGSQPISYSPSTIAFQAGTMSEPSRLDSMGTPLLIDLTGDSQRDRYLDLPVRPGDTLFVPPAGSVSTVGWVQHPETFPITNRLSVMGAVAASGGPLYAADTSKVRLLRKRADRQLDIIVVDIDSIQEGKSQDVALRDGDIVDVPYSAAKIPGYAIYYAAQGLVTYTPAGMAVRGIAP